MESAENPITAGDVARGVCRLLHRMGLAAQREVPLPNGRRADLLAICAKGELTLIEIKVSLADLRGDHKWPDYLDYCDRFFWAVPPAMPRDLFALERMGAGRAGLIVADAHDGAVLVEAARVALAGARRRAETLRFARRAAARLSALADPELLVDA